jgi:hypothetical protein
MQRIFQKIKNTATTVSIYIYSLLLFVINNRQHFKINSDIHNINTRNNLDLHCHSLIGQFTRRVHITSNCHTTQSNLKLALKSFFVPRFFLLTGRIFQIQYKLNFKVVCNLQELNDVTESLLQSSFRNPIEFYYN